MNRSIGMICHYGVGGSARVAVDLAGNLAARGHDLHLIARSAPFAAAPPAGVRLHAMHPLPVTTTLDTAWSADDLAAFTDLVCEVARNERLDVLHFHYAVPFAAVAQAVRTALGRTSPRTVLTLHGTDVSVFGEQPRMRRAVAALVREIDAVTTVSHSHAALARDVFAMDEPPAVIPNFVNTDVFRPRPRPAGRPRVAYVSNFRPVKDPEAMARIARQALAEIDAELWLVGGGQRLAAAQALLADREALGQVRRLGVVLDPERVLPAADALLVTSRMESFGLVALEAMSCGVPVLAPRVGGLPELVEHGVSGLLYEPGDEAQAVRWLVSLLDDSEVRARLGAGARERALRYCSSTVVPRYEQLYERLLDGVHPPALPEFAAG